MPPSRFFLALLTAPRKGRLFPIRPGGLQTKRPQSPRFGTSPAAALTAPLLLQ